MSSHHENDARAEASDQSSLYLSATSTNSAPTNGSGTTLEPNFPGGLGIGGGIGYVFSARTCLDILHKLTEEQLDREIQVLESFDTTAHNKVQSSTGAITRSKKDTEIE